MRCKHLDWDLWNDFALALSIQPQPMTYFWRRDALLNGHFKHSTTTKAFPNSLCCRWERNEYW